MSKYTTEERYICEEEAGFDRSQGFDKVDEVLDKSWDKIFTTNAEIFDEDYRPVICKKILKHFYTREIGAETVGLWKLWMNRTMEEQLPYYNQLYKSALLKFPVFENVDYKTKHKKENTGETTQDTTDNENSGYTTDITGNKSVITTGTKDNITDNTTNTIGSETIDTVTTDKKETEGKEDIYIKTSDTTDTIGNAHVIAESTGTKDTTGAEDITVTKTGDKTSNEEGKGTNTNTETNTHNDTTTNEGSKTNKNDHWDKYSDTPEGALSNITNDGDQWLTEIREITDDGTETHQDTTINNGGYTTTGNGSDTNNKDYSESWSETDKTGETRTEGIKTSDNSETTTDTTENKTSEGTNDTNETRSEIVNDYGTSNTQENSTEDQTYHGTSGDQYRDDQETTYNENTTNKANKEDVYNALGSSHDLEDFAEKVKGKQGSETYSEMLMKFRDTFLNIDMELISRFEENFLQLW